MKFWHSVKKAFVIDNKFFWFYLFAIYGAIAGLIVAGVINTWLSIGDIKEILNAGTGSSAWLGEIDTIFNIHIPLVLWGFGIWILHLVHMMWRKKQIYVDRKYNVRFLGWFIAILSIVLILLLVGYGIGSGLDWQMIESKFW